MKSGFYFFDFPASKSWSLREYMKKLFFLIMLMGMFSPKAYTQKYKSGYVVTNSNDTLKGYLLDAPDRKVALVINFKKLKNDKLILRFADRDLSAFGFNYGRIFCRLNFRAANNGTADSVNLMAKRNINGKLDLYSREFQDHDQPDIFLFDRSLARWIRLTEPQEYSYTLPTGISYKTKDKNYMGLLRITLTDSAGAYKLPPGLPYNERSITREVVKYDRMYNNTYPVTRYIPHKEFDYSLTAGVPFSAVKRKESRVFRLSFFRYRYYPEKSFHWYTVQGISYRYWKSLQKFDAITRDSNLNFEQQFVSILPIGIGYQARPRFITPYFYCAAGLAFYLETDHHIENYVDYGDKTIPLFFPAISPGAGIRIKAGPGKIHIEVTPTYNAAGLYFNIGYTLGSY